MWQDNTSKVDLLGFELHSDIIIELIKEDAMMPLTLGVFGDWGSGKSSILESIECKLTTSQFKEDGVYCIQFNGWSFEGYDDAKAALMEAIVSKIEAEFTTKEGVKAVAKKLYHSINWMRVAKAALPVATAYFSGGASLIPQIASGLKDIIGSPEKITSLLTDGNLEEKLSGFIKNSPDQVSAESQSVRDFRDNMGSLLEKSKIKKLVVIVDDLDRCLPERIIDNLEAMKLFLNVQNTVFIIGADSRIVESAIAHRYKERFPIEPSYSDGEDAMDKKIVRDYLEKLIQVPYNLPKLSDTEVNTYITLLFCQNQLGGKFDDLYKDFVEYKKENRYHAYDVQVIKERKGKSFISELADDCLLICKLSGLIATCLKGNPRQIKRFLNMYMLRKKIKDIAGMLNFDETILAKLMILEYTAPSLFAEIYEDMDIQTGVSDILKDYECIGAELPKQWSDSSTSLWLQAEPKLADRNLMDYFWLSRDKLSSLSSMYMADPIVRSILEEVTAAGLSDAIIRNLINEKLIPLNTSQRISFYNLLKDMIVANSGERGLYKIFEICVVVDEDAKALYKSTMDLIPDKKQNPAAKKAYIRFLNPKQ